MIQNTGSDTMVNLAQAWAEEYAQGRPDGVGRGLRRRLGHRASPRSMNGTVDIANCSREIEPQEIEQAKKNTGKEPQEFIVGYDALAVYVHKDNPIEEITLEQLAEIYGEGGTIDQVVAAGRDDARTARTRSSASAARPTRAPTPTSARPCSARDATSSSARATCTGSKDVVDLVSQDAGRHRLQRHGLRDARGEDAARRRKTGEPAFAPTVENTLNQTYPIARPLFMYTLGEPTGAGEEVPRLDPLRRPARRSSSRAATCPLPNGRRSSRDAAMDPTRTRRSVRDPAAGGQMLAEAARSKLLIRLCGISAILFVFGIFFFVFREGAGFLFHGFNLGEFFTSPEWYPTSQSHVRYGVLALLAGTVSVTALAMAIAVPFGLGAAVFISEFCGPAAEGDAQDHRSSCWRRSRRSSGASSA